MTGFEDDSRPDAGENQSAKGGNPEPANEDLPDGQFDDQEMPTTDGEPAEPDPRPEAP
jgi:hypothetical protein